MNSNNPAVYVGTYHKYNCGSIFGKWLDLTNYSDKYDFLEDCKELHSDEDDPEFMYQDFENFPDELYSESSISEVFEYLDALEQSRMDQEAFDAGVAIGFGLNEIKDKYIGEFDSCADFAEEYAIEFGLVSENDWSFYHINWQKVWDSEFKHSCIEENGHFFYND